MSDRSRPPQRTSLALAWAVSALLAACGGADAPTAEPSAAPGRESSQAVAISTTATTATSAAPLLDPNTVMDWAEWRFASLFPKGPDSFELVFQDVLYTVRGYSTGNFLGITTSGGIFGLGPFTGSVLQGFGNSEDYAAQVFAEACQVRPAACLAPVVQTPPQGLRVAPGQAASFSVAAGGSAPLRYQWRRNGVDIAGATRASYTLEAPTLADDGARFSVWVSNSAGRVQSAEATLQVQPAAPVQPGQWLLAAARSAPAPAPALAVNQSLVYVDPLAPASARLVRNNTVAGVGQEALQRGIGFVLPVATEARAWDAAARSSQHLGRPLSVFVQGGMVYKVDMQRGAATAAVRVSSITNACQVFEPIALDGSGTDAWVAVSTGGTDNQCSTSADNESVYVRTIDDESAAPRRPALTRSFAGTPLLALRDGNGRLLWLLGNGTGGARLLRPADLATGPAITGLGSRSLFGLAPDPAEVLAGYVATAFSRGQLLRLSWNEAGAAVSTPLYTFTGDLGGGAVDRSAAWFADGNRLLRISGSSAATLVATLPSAGPVEDMLQTDDHLVVTQGVISGTLTEISTVPKAGGTVVQLASAPRATTLLSVLGTRGRSVVYSLQPEASVLETTATVISVDADNSNRSTLATQASVVAGVMNRTWVLGRPQLDAVVYCQAAAGGNDCRSGRLLLHPLGQATPTVLGSFSGYTSVPAFLPSALEIWSGLPFVLQINAGAVQDAWLAVPDASPALTRFP